MPTHVALIRGINVGGKKLLAMADLRSISEALGLANCTTLLQSGNLMFTSRRPSGALESLLESAISKRCKLEVDVMVRSSDDIHAVVAKNPFRKEAASDPSHLVVVFLKSEPGAGALTRLRETIRAREAVHAVGRELYAFYPDGIGTSKLTNAVIEKTLGTPGTARNWNTVGKIDAALNGG